MKKIVFAGLMFIMLFHASMTVLYNSPINPIKVKLGFIIDNYMNPLFSQNWNLFAPNPVSTNMDIVTRGGYKDSNGNEKTTDWVNITKTFTTNLQNNRFDINRLTLASIRTSGTNVQEAMFKNKDFLEKNNVKNNADLHVLYDVSKRTLSRTYEENIDRIEVRMVTSEFPEYGKKGEVKKTYLSLPVQNISALGEKND
ncbi:DUF5819 family protein [Bacillus tropicus]|uniref:DUF5819 family protein n=1 Tax=Bacillus TaxID=1386 RepID=UPI000B438A5D|nr:MULTISPECIES: DUF5819 family protein [Bacillus]OTX88384.1 hypothetical protein BK728_05055 [Bacillus thuringiensis serovar chanpaisis]PNK25430.1 hypothetical protein CBR56_21735 [Bacillus thuringiensis]MED3038000.1 DUF5819 family protein [Bacillus tropicus]PGB54861.1 hypothetical protein COL95_08310 [Bacillus anthracis]WBO92782.1 DUF5819 family protein [Bacillus tropicus]